ncbi:MAG: CoB--CoM heterodisulfide reductase iron-sulfur subunit B family protein [Firmicutes bacterium]|nr:CoB--CoM heterodisulfide reductase iron-sulfur subunit B family protein [Bacillota bacterium]
MNYTYFPGCTLHSQARNFDESARTGAAALGVSLEEPSSWQCCGAVFPLVTDIIMPLASPFRTLTRAGQKGNDGLVTLCSACYNVFKRTNHLVKNDAEKRHKLESFVDEGAYCGDLPVLHLLEVLRDKIGFKNLQEKVSKTLEGLRVAPYYGCLLLRPKDEVAFDDLEDPQIIENFLASLGAEPVKFPYRTECCGAYVSVASPDKALKATKAILYSANKHQADCIVVSCPLCQYNLDEKQQEILDGDNSFRPLPVLYFTQLLAIALGLDEKVCHFDRHRVDPQPLLRQKNLIPEVK